jgi:hypothetical protein
MELTPAMRFVVDDAQHKLDGIKGVRLEQFIDMLRTVFEDDDMRIENIILNADDEQVAIETIKAVQNMIEMMTTMMLTMIVCRVSMTPPQEERNEL